MIRLVEHEVNGEAGEPVVHYIATGKYADALPLYRQCQQLQRIGVELSRTTVARWMVGAGEVVVPLINVLRDELVDWDLGNIGLAPRGTAGAMKHDARESQRPNRACRTPHNGRCGCFPAAPTASSISPRSSAR